MEVLAMIDDTLEDTAETAEAARLAAQPADSWLVGDDITHLREWGTHRTYPLPPSGAGTIGTADSCAVQLVDDSRRVSREHAHLLRLELPAPAAPRWLLRDLGSKNGTRFDGVLRPVFPLAAGLEVSLGPLTLIAESPGLVALRGYLARLLGWGDDRIAAIDRALRALRAAALRRATLLVCGEGDLVPLAQSLHRRILGDAHPFVVCDPRRGSQPATVRMAGSQHDGHRALKTAKGGTMCVRARRLPQDFSEVWRALHEPAARVRLAVCADDPSDTRVQVGLPISIPALVRRRMEIDRIVDEFARDAIDDLGADPAGFTRADRTWVLDHSASSLADIEKGTRRLVALRQAGSISRAAARLGMSHVSLSQWLRRRRMPRGGPQHGV